MSEKWIDPRDAEFFAELKRLTKDLREEIRGDNTSPPIGRISEDTSQRGVKLPPLLCNNDDIDSSLDKPKNTKLAVGGSITIGLAIAGVAIWLFRRRAKNNRE